MPCQPSAGSLRSSCLATIARHYELLAYGCRDRKQMNRLLDSEGTEYRRVEGPFTLLPSSLLEDLIQAVYDIRLLPKESLHQLLLPQLKRFAIRNRSSVHIQTCILQERCSQLESLEFSHNTSIQPMFHVKFLSHFPRLVRISLEGSLLDDEAWNSLARVCLSLREVLAQDSTISDTGLLHLCRDPDTGVARCRGLLLVTLARTKCSPRGVAQLLHYHPSLAELGWPDLSPVFQCFHDPGLLGELQDQAPPSHLNLRRLHFSSGELSQEGVTTALCLCPRVCHLSIRPASLPSSLLQDLLAPCTNISSLDLGNSKISEHTLHFEEGVVPVLHTLGPRLVSLRLERLPELDLLTLAALCPKLRLLRLAAIASFLPVFDFSRQCFPHLQELEVLNTRGAHVYTNTLRQLLSSSHQLQHIKLQFVDTLNDEVCEEVLRDNPLANLISLTLDQCHSVSVHTLLLFLGADNPLTELYCWYCRFITETDHDTVRREIALHNYDLHFNWYQFTGEEAPVLLEDIEDMEELEDTTESDWEEEEDGWDVPPLD